ncbi:hypothetical protein NKG05_02450 [Oerskovia sp. M15]
MRTVDEFAGGRMAWADGEHESGSTRLGLIPVPLPAEIATDPQFVVAIVEREVFEGIWRKANQGT